MESENKHTPTNPNRMEKEMDTSTEQNIKILFVDDDETILMALSKFLEKGNFTVKTATNADEGFSIATRFQPDIIISDVEMPEKKGTDLLKIVRDTPEIASVIFILSSGKKIRSKDLAQGLDKGADDYIIKPIVKEELLAKIRSFYRIKSLRDKLQYSNKKIEKALAYAKSYKKELEKKNNALEKEKKLIENSLKQLSLMTEERERTTNELKLVNHQRENDLKSLIKLLAHIIDARRKHRRGHAKKVSEISVFIASELELSGHEIRDIEIAALLHEIGLLSISDTFAAKESDAYTEQEKQFLSRHPVKGADLLEDFSFFKDISKIIRHYHEHVDGSGVPDGLKREAVPIGSRIIAVADIYDILVYRKKDPASLKSVEDSLSLIENDVGVKYDPVVYHALFKYVMKNPVDEADKTRELRIYELESGMELASGIFTEKGAKLLPKDTVLTEENITRILQYGKTETLEETVFVKL